MIKTRTGDVFGQLKKITSVERAGGITDNEKHASMTSNDIHLTSNSNHIIVMCAEITVMFRVTHEAFSQQKAAGKPEREQPGCPKCAGRFFHLINVKDECFVNLV